MFITVNVSNLSEEIREVLIGWPLGEFDALISEAPGFGCNDQWTYHFSQNVDETEFLAAFNRAVSESYDSYAEGDDFGPPIN